MTQRARSGDEFSQETFSKKAFTDAEKFELLSAYLDDEVTEQERRLVEHWLSSDLQLQKHYQAQLRLHSAMRAVFDEPSQPSSNLFSAEPPEQASQFHSESVISNPSNPSNPTEDNGSPVGPYLRVLGSRRALGF
jgi:hypothetical protein